MLRTGDTRWASSAASETQLVRADRQGSAAMAKGNKNRSKKNQPKLSVKEKRAKKAEKKFGKK